MTAAERAAKQAEAEEAKRKAAEEAAAAEAAKKDAERKAKEDAEAKRKEEEAARKAEPVDADHEFSLNERLVRYRVAGEERTVRACQINRRFFIQTPEGKQSGDVGDWIVQRQDGTRAVVSKEVWLSRQPKPVDGLKRVQ